VASSRLSEVPNAEIVLAGTSSASRMQEE
jgi:hypothetical protein